MINYGLKIKEYRELKFLTQDEFSKVLGVSKTSVNRWETGKFAPTLKIKKRIYQLLIEAGIEIE